MERGRGKRSQKENGWAAFAIMEGENTLASIERQIVR